MSDCLKEMDLTSYSLVQTESGKVFQSDQPEPLVPGFYIMHKESTIVHRTRHPGPITSSKSLLLYSFGGYNIAKWAQPVLPTKDWFGSSGGGSSYAKAEENGLRHFESTRPRIHWTRFLIPFHFILHRKEGMSMKLSLQPEKLVASLEAAISSGTCIVTGEPAVPGSFFSSAFHTDAIIKSFHANKEYATAAEPDFADSSATTVGADSETALLKEERELQLEEIREEYGSKEKFGYLNVGVGSSQPRFRRHAVSSRVSRALDHVYNPSPNPPFDEEEAGIESRSLRNSGNAAGSTAASSYYSRNLLKSSRDRYNRTN